MYIYIYMWMDLEIPKSKLLNKHSIISLFLAFDIGKLSVRLYNIKLCELRYIIKKEKNLYV